MKKTFLALAVLGVMTSTAGFANRRPAVDEGPVAAAFVRDFSKATLQHSDQQDGITKLTFTLNDQVMFAYYTSSGELLAVIHNVLSTQLPLRLMAELKKDFSQYWISDLFEMSTDEQTTYYVTLQNAEQTIVLRSAGSGQWTRHKKIKKSLI